MVATRRRRRIGPRRAYSRLAGAIVQGTTFAHLPDFRMEFTVTALPVADSVRLRFRKQDGSNYWYVVITPTGDLSLAETVAGAVTQRAGTAGVVAAGHKVVVTTSGATITGSNNGVQRWSYASATTFQTATAGELFTDGTGNPLADLATYPY